MRKRLLLAATLGALAMIPAPAWAHGHDPVPQNVGSSFGIRIMVRDGPTVVHHHHPGRHYRPQPWPRHFRGHAPSARWYAPWHHQRRDFHWRDRDHRPSFRAPGAPHFRHGDGKRWSHAPWHHGRPAARNYFPHPGFKHGHPGSGPRRHR